LVTGPPAQVNLWSRTIGEKDERKLLPALGLKARIFVALVGISSVTSLVIGLVLYYFAQDRMVKAENNLLIERSQTANAGAQDFLEGLRNPEDQTLPPPDTYAEELVQAVADPTGLKVLHIGPDGEPLAARDGLGNPLNARKAYEALGLSEETLRRVAESRGGEGRLVQSESSNYVTVWPLTDTDGTVRGAMVYDAPRDELEGTLAYLRYGILGAILTSVLLAGAASFLLTRQVTRPLSETRDAAIRVAGGDYATVVPVKSRDELGEVARAFNYMAEEIEHYVGEIQEQKSRLEAVLEASPEALVTTDPEGCITMVNPAAARMLGIRVSDQGRTFESLGAPRGILQCLREAAANGVAVREIELGDKAYWAYAAQMNRDEGNGRVGGDTGIILAVRDITEHRSLERAKTAFVSDVSHELRTPLTTIQSAVGLLERARERLDPLEHRALELADGELKRIRGMVEELLTLAQMDSWQYQLEVGPTDLSRIVQTAIESVQSKAERFGTEIHFDGAAEHRCVCDAQKLYQVFLNLLDNAIKYSEAGARVDITIEEDVSSLSVEVRDTGVGIPPEELAQLFERFYRVDKDRSRATGGSGLGLAISKRIVEMHGGDISVESEVGVGSTFTVRLPKAPLSRSASYAL
jgi:signal transduction histidine kinase